MKAFIFDFDGVILDSQRCWDEAVVEVYKRTFPTLLADKDAFMGKSERMVFKELSKEHKAVRSDEEHFKDIDTYARGVYARAPLTSGVLQLIERLEALQVPFGIATSSSRPWLEDALKRQGLLERFWTLATADEVPRSKPYPDVYLLAADRLGMDPKLCVAIEDSPNGMRAAKTAGMYGIGYVPHGNVSSLTEADMHVLHHDEIDDAMLRNFFA